MVLELEHGLLPRETANIVSDLTPAQKHLVPVSNYVMVGGVWVPLTTLTIESSLSLLVNSSESLEDLGSATRSDLALIHNTLAGLRSEAAILDALATIGYRKVLGVDAGAYVAPAGGATTFTFTGVNLLGKAFVVFDRTYKTLHYITNIVDPAGGAVGTITVDRPFISTPVASVLVVPYMATPHAWNSATDATQTLAVAGDPPRINGPATFLAWNAALAANQQIILPCALYGRYQIDITWYTAGTTLVQFNIFGKYNDAAWGALGTIPPGYSQNTKFQTVAGVAFGAPPIGGGAAGVTANILCARMQDPDGFNSLAIEMNSINRDAVAVVVTGTYGLAGGTR